MFKIRFMLGHFDYFSKTKYNLDILCWIVHKVHKIRNASYYVYMLRSSGTFVLNIYIWYVCIGT